MSENIFATTNEARSWNFKLLAHNELAGFGGMGEGLSMQTAPDGRRILWMAHESAPKNFSGVDVTDPLNPKMIIQTDLPQAYMRSNSLAVVGNMMAVAYQTKQQGMQPAGFELFDITVPEAPKSISFFDASGPKSRGVHQLWFCDGRYIHMAAGSEDFRPRVKSDDQFYRIVDVADPAKPFEVGRWWLPGVSETDPEPIKRHEKKTADFGFRAHNTNVYPERPDRAYIGYLDGGMVILDISDMSRPKMVTRWDNSPPFDGFTHTVMPLFSRDLLVVTDECTRDDGSDGEKLIWIVDARDETNTVPISTLPAPAREPGRADVRVGAHNIHENEPVPNAWKSDQIVIGTFFGGGLRAYDISSPFQPKEVGYFIPPGPQRSPNNWACINDVFVDDRGIVFAVDRNVGGLYVLEMNF